MTNEERVTQIVDDAWKLTRDKGAFLPLAVQADPRWVELVSEIGVHAAIAAIPSSRRMRELKAAEVKSATAKVEKKK